MADLTALTYAGATAATRAHNNVAAELATDVANAITALNAITATTTELNALDGAGMPVYSSEVTVTEDSGAGVYTGSISLPAGATLIDVVVHAVALWTSETSATGKVGDVADDDGIFTGIDLKATDLLAGESLSPAFAGGKAGADIANSQWNRRYLATARVISLIVTKVGTTGTAGRTRMTVVWSAPSAEIGRAHV